MPRYDGPILDAHHHLWDLSLGRHPWLTDAGVSAKSGKAPEGLRHDYVVSDYLADARGQNIVASVHIEALWAYDEPGGETAWLDSLDKTQGIASRYVAGVRLGTADAAARLEAEAAHTRVVGIRDILSWQADPTKSFARSGDLMQDAAWRGDLGRLRDLDLAFDLMVFAPQLQEAARLVADFPNQLFVLNHCGSPIDRTPEGMAAWAAGLQAVAAADNVAIKVSDLVAYDNDWTLESLREVALRCIDTFGPERSIFASDFPVAGLWATFDEVWESFKTITESASAAEQKALFYGNARRVYRLDDLPA